MDKSKHSAVSILVSDSSINLGNQQTLFECMKQFDMNLETVFRDMKILMHKFKANQLPPWKYYLAIQKVRGKRILMWRKSARGGDAQSFVSLFDVTSIAEREYLNHLSSDQYSLFCDFEAKRQLLNLSYTALFHVSNYYKSLQDIRIAS